MTSADALKVGWCPGALRPMESGDGLILRVKPSGGILGLDQAEALARLSLRHGNGHLDLTGRANLQIRGASAATLDALVAGLDTLGLLDKNPESEAIRNIVASPLAGLDPEAYDIGPIVVAIEERLAADRTLRRLPPKWSFVVDDGGTFPLSAVAADIRFVFGRDGTVWVGLDGDPLWGRTSVDRVADVASALAGIATSGRQPSRMRLLVQAAGAAALFQRAGVPLAESQPLTRPSVQISDILGLHGKPVPYLGAAPAFASLAADDLLRIVEAARLGETRDLRLTPWRVILLTDVRKSGPALAALARSSIAVDPSDPRLRIAACTGAPACHRGTTATRADAAELAFRLDGRSPGTVHISGCPKGCAHPAAAAWTLVGRGGRYDLVRDGTAKDIPIARGLTFNEAATWVSRTINVRTA